MKETKNISLRGRSFTGTVVSAKMQKTATVEWLRRLYVPKYERYTVRRTRVKAHNPDEIRAEEGDRVRISECRKLSKTKSFMIVENLGKEKGFLQRKEALDEGKKRKAAEKTEAKEADEQ